MYIRKLYGGDYIYLLIYVDDMLIASKGNVQINKLKTQHGKEFETKGLGVTKKTLGMNIRRERSNQYFFFSRKV